MRRYLLLFLFLLFFTDFHVYSETINVVQSNNLVLVKNVMVVDLQKGFYEITEIFNFINRSNSIVRSKGNTPTFKFILPISSNVRNPNAVWSSAPVGLDPSFYEMSKNSLISRESFSKGEKFILLRYRLADSYGGIQIKKPIFFDSPNFTLLTSKKNVQMEMDEIKASNVLKLNGKEYNQYLLPLRSSSNFSLNLKAPDSLGRLDYFYVFSGVLVLFGVAFGFWYRRSRAKNLEHIHQREQLLRKIASLDDLKEANRIEEKIYNEEREFYFTRLIELSK
ncbi:MAG: hypothetical protein VX794_10300 [Nitrospinota bacterium]|nr:hypothetical protein [Nitrospinota bacterium]